MIFELVDIIREPFGLPDWSLKVTFFNLFAGFLSLLLFHGSMM